MTPMIASAIFVFGYLAITFEHKIKINKSALALFMGGILWLLLGIHNKNIVHDEMSHAIYEIFNIVIFLLAAMCLVEILAHYRLFDVIRKKIYEYELTDRSQFLVVLILSFILSGIIDNLTTTIVMVQISKKFFKGENLFIAATGVVIASNAGGAFSPIGDATTIMLWLAGKFTTAEIVLGGILPSIALLVSLIFLMIPKMKEQKQEALKEEVTPLTKSEKIVIGVTIIAFFFPVIAKHFGLPPVLGLLFGLGVSWMMVDSFRYVSKTKTHFTASIEKLIQKSDIASIQFFIGILLAVSALGAFGVLEHLSTLIYGGDLSLGRIISGNVVLGMVSSILDNIPLTAIAIDILPFADPKLWVLLALTVGTGGSLLSIGSAAGVVAMGMVEGLSCEKYFKIGFMPALLSFFVCVAVWSLQYFLF